MHYIWTSGRKCNFNGCNRPDLQPPNVNGWFWSGSGAKIGPTTQRSSGDWSHTGGFGQPQPDNREAPQVQKCQTGYLLAIGLWGRRGLTAGRLHLPFHTLYLLKNMSSSTHHVQWLLNTRGYMGTIALL